MSDKKNYKILCLHGYRQNSQTFKTKCGGFRKILKNRCDFGNWYQYPVPKKTNFVYLIEKVFIDAPNLIPEGEQNPSFEKDCLSWWFSGENPDYFSSKHVTDFVKGFDQSIKLICDTFQQQGPFDGLFGFSQGASLVALICILKHFAEFPHEFKFVILCSGFKSLTQSHVKLFDRMKGEKISLPSLHIIGQSDQVVDPSRSESLARDLFRNPTILFHSGGHTVPSQTSFRSQYQNFLDNFQNHD